MHYRRKNRSSTHTHLVINNPDNLFIHLMLHFPLTKLLTRFCETLGSSYPHISRRLSKPALLVLPSASPALPCSFSLLYPSPLIYIVHTSFRDIIVSDALHPHSPHPTYPLHLTSLHDALGPTLTPFDLSYASHIPAVCTTRLTLHFSSFSFFLRSVLFVYAYPHPSIFLFVPWFVFLID